MIVARQFGFGAIHGVEVEDIYSTASKVRLKYLPHMYPGPYNGSHLPYADGQFAVVTSGHVIEHTGTLVSICMRACASWPPAAIYL